MSIETTISRGYNLPNTEPITSAVSQRLDVIRRKVITLREKIGDRIDVLTSPRVDPYQTLRYPENLTGGSERVIYQTAGLYYSLQEASSAALKNPSLVTRRWKDQAEKDLKVYLKTNMGSRRMLRAMMNP